jgi:hypothetical protein
LTLTDSDAGEIAQCEIERATHQLRFEEKHQELIARLEQQQLALQHQEKEFETMFSSIKQEHADELDVS